MPAARVTDSLPPLPGMVQPRAGLEIADWAVAAFLQVESYNARGFAQAMRDGHRMFTDTGWTVLTRELEEAGVPAKVRSGQYDVTVESSGPSEAVRLSGAGDDGTVWLVSFVARLKDRQQANDVWHYYPQSVCVKRVGVTQDHPNGLAVCGIHVAPAYSPKA